MESAMVTTTLRLDATLKRRIANLAKASGRTPHSLMVEALEQKADEIEAQNAFARAAAKRDQALQAGQKGAEWHAMKTWLRGTAKANSPTTMITTKTVETKARPQK